MHDQSLLLLFLCLDSQSFPLSLLFTLPASSLSTSLSIICLCVPSWLLFSFSLSFSLSLYIDGVIAVLKPHWLLCYEGAHASSIVPIGTCWVLLPPAPPTAPLPLLLLLLQLPPRYAKVRRWYLSYAQSLQPRGTEQNPPAWPFSGVLSQQEPELASEPCRAAAAMVTAVVIATWLQGLESCWAE